jgi:hypothetical protein
MYLSFSCTYLLQKKELIEIIINDPYLVNLGYYEYLLRANSFHTEKMVLACRN